MAEGLKEHEHMLEEKFQQKELKNFKSMTCIYRLFGLKMANRLGYTKIDTERYVDELLMTYLENASRELLLKKVEKDLNQAGIYISQQQLRHELIHCHQEVQKASQ